MKTLIMVVLAQLLSLYSFSQPSMLKGKWKPQAESPRIQHLEFKMDTLSILFSSGREAEIMSFTQHHDSLLIKKISGSGACAAGSEGLYHIEWLVNGEKILLHKISDDCSGRALGFTSNSFEKIKN